jgi:hypothetical protein
MPAQPKRLPGEQNPRADAPFVNTDRASGGRGNDYGIARGIFALLDWVKRRGAARARR